MYNTSKFDVLFSAQNWRRVQFCQLNARFSDVYVVVGEVGNIIQTDWQRWSKYHRSSEHNHSEWFNSRIILHIRCVGCWL